MALYSHGFKTQHEPERIVDDAGLAWCDIVMAYIVMAYTVMAYIVTA